MGKKITLGVLLLLALGFMFYQYVIVPHTQPKVFKSKTLVDTIIAPKKNIESPVAQAQPKDMISVMENAYRLKPDKRFLLAIEEVYLFFSGEKPDKIDVSFENDAWQIKIQDKVVGTLPEYPDFGDGIGLLTALTKELENKYPLANTTKATQEQISDIQQLIDKFYPKYLVNALTKIESTWQTSHDPQLLVYATQALTYLASQSLDSIDATDPLTAKALAILSITKVLTIEDTKAYEAFLSYSMEYSKQAEQMALNMDDAAAVKHYITKNDSTLREIALKSNAIFPHYLFLLRLSTREQPRDWYDWWQRNLFSKDSSLLAMKTGLGMNNFTLNEEYSQILPFIVLSDLKGDQKEEEVSVFKTFIDHLINNTPLEPILSVLNRNSVRQIIEQFESLVVQTSPAEKGLFIDPESYQSFYRGHFYSSLFIMGRFYLDQLSSQPAAKDFCDNLQNATAPMTQQFAGWYKHLVDSRMKQVEAQIFIDDINNATLLGFPLKNRTMKEFLHRSHMGTAEIVHATNNKGVKS